MARPDGPAVSGSSRPALRPLVWTAGILLAAKGVLGAWETAHPPGQRPDLVRWVPAAEADAAAKKSKKPMLIEFTADWCPPCKVMAREVFQNERHAAYINDRFVPVRCLEDAPGSRKLQEQYEISAYPTLVIVAGGREVGRRRGYGGADATMGFLRRHAEAPRRQRKATPAEMKPAGE